MELRIEMWDCIAFYMYVTIQIKVCFETAGVVTECILYLVDLSRIGATDVATPSDIWTSVTQLMLLLIRSVAIQIKKYC